MLPKRIENDSTQKIVGINVSISMRHAKIMRSLLLSLVLLIFVIAVSVAGQTQNPATAASDQSGFSLSNLDQSADPCVDFYQFACGTWKKNNPIPADQASWGSFAVVHERNQQILHATLEKNSAEDPKRSTVEREIGDFYYACMDEQTINSKGIEALKPELDRIAAIQNRDQLIQRMAYIELLQGTSPIFDFSSSPDLHDASMVIADLDQGGILMPDRDYYLKDDDKTKAVRDAYVTYMKKVFVLAGQSEAQAAESAQTILNIETELAKASLDRTARRDPEVSDHKMTLDAAAALAPNLELKKWVSYAGVPSFTSLNVDNPDFLKQANLIFDKYPVDAWKRYLEWQMLNFSAPWLSDPFVQARFHYRQTLFGQKELPVRWKRCVDQTNFSLGEALGQSFVDETFGVEGKQRMLKMVNALERSLHQDIAELPWMTDETKKQAEIKLAAIRNKIGYPDKWRDYSSIKITRDDFLGNYIRASQFEAHREANKIGKPLDRTEWGMTPPTVNAYYNGQYNEIVFPAGILQPPFFNRNADDASNYGAIGAVIGHELTHGFDDEGRKFDPQGNLRDWWTPVDAREFEKRVACVVNEYSGFTAVDDVKLNGKLTLGENTADNGGARIALMALLSTLREQAKSTQATEDPLTQKIEGFTPEQRFFLGFASVWCENVSDQFARFVATVDPHSPGRWRTNGVLQNMPEFQKAFSCKAGQPMVSANACHVW